MAFIVRLARGDGWVSFENPLQVYRTESAEEAFSALDACDRARAVGHWTAGYVSYEGPALLGIFDAPKAWHPPEAAFALSPLLRSIACDEYDENIARIARAIYDGDVYQVNYTVPFDIALRGDRASAFASIAKETGAHFQAYVEDGERAILSWSPELFLQIDGNRVATRPMKGTASPGNEHELLGEKNRGEHVMIVDLLRNDLRRVCHDVSVRDLCAIERYPTYSTMTTTIEGTLVEGATLGALFRAAFPCGSVTGAPKRAAMQHITKIERRERGAYCGAIGYLSPERRGWWSVAIRTAQFQGELGRFDVGGGVVIDSRSHDEWREIETKSSFLRKRSEPIEIIETLAGDASQSTIEAHVDRALEAARKLDIPLASASLRARIDESLHPTLLVRLRIAEDSSIAVLTEPLTKPREARICLSRARVSSGDPWLGIKTSWRPKHDVAAEEARERGCFDALLQNERGELTEGARTNLFLELDGELCTPPLRCGLLPGILRAELLAQGRARERVVDVHDLERATALFVGNSARGLIRAELDA